eukprot:3190684-Amphidinium_carterae.2
MSSLPWLTLLLDCWDREVVEVAEYSALKLLQDCCNSKETCLTTPPSNFMHKMHQSIEKCVTYRCGWLVCTLWLQSHDMYSVAG